MFNVGGAELLVIIVVALIVLGPQRLPEAMRTFGRVMGEVRRISSGFQQEIRDALEDAELADPGGPGRRREAVPLAATVAAADADADTAAELDAAADDRATDPVAAADGRVADAPAVADDRVADAAADADTDLAAIEASADPAASDGDHVAAAGAVTAADMAGDDGQSDAAGREPPGLAPVVADALDSIVAPLEGPAPADAASATSRAATSAAATSRAATGDGRAAS